MNNTGVHSVKGFHKFKLFSTEAIGHSGICLTTSSHWEEVVFVFAKVGQKEKSFPSFLVISNCKFVSVTYHLRRRWGK